MFTGETGFDDVAFDRPWLSSVRGLKADHDYGQHVCDARNAGQDDIAVFFEEVMNQDANALAGATSSLRALGGTDNTSPQG